MSDWEAAKAFWDAYPVGVRTYSAVKEYEWAQFVRRRCEALRMTFAEYHAYRDRLRADYAKLGGES